MQKYLAVLRTAVLFEGLSDEEILAVLHCLGAAVSRKQKGETILRAGDTAAYMGILLTGSALIIQEDIWGRRNIMARVNPGEPFAEQYAAARDAVLDFSVAASEDCEILKLDIDRILTLCPSACSHHTHMVKNLVAVLVHKTILINEKITHMSKRTTRDKLLSYLSAEAARHGALSFDIPYDRQQLADFLCVERAAMSVELSRLQKEGILKTSKAHFTLLVDTLNENT